MILIADSGATKINWRLLCDDGSVLQKDTEGINSVFASQEQLMTILSQSVIEETSQKVDKVFFYGAGVFAGEITDRLESCFKKVYPNAKCEFYSDLLAAAHCLCGHKSGIACIMGTGSNSCFYDGSTITNNVRAGGFILGDEGSGGYLGRQLVSDFVKGLLPQAIDKEFNKRYNLDYLTIVRKVYNEPQPSRFLASFSPFIYEFRNHPYFSRIIRDGFDNFFKRNIIQYDYKKYEVNIVGSIAYYYKDFLEKTAKANDMRIGKILKTPIDSLVEYYK